jgi:hypothetical protein
VRQLGPRMTGFIVKRLGSRRTAGAVANMGPERANVIVNKVSEEQGTTVPSSGLDSIVAQQACAGTCCNVLSDAHGAPVRRAHRCLC